MRATVENVKIVEGSTLNIPGDRYLWKRKMQVVTTDIGEYIDCFPGDNGKWRAPDFNELKGQEIEFDLTDDGGHNVSYGYKGRTWIKLIK